MVTLLGKTLPELQQVALSVGLQKFAGKQLAEWIYQKRVRSFDEMTNISQKGREALAAQYTLSLTAPLAEAKSVDGTKKYLFGVADTQTPLNNTKPLPNYVETVFIPDDDRATLCVSTQAGCKMGCRFCMTGTLGFHGNLTAAEILNQVFSIPDSAQLTNIVFMGEGEPCDNIDEVLRAIEVLTAPWGCAWSPRRITVSSVGYLPHLKTLIEQSDCHIAISLHNPFPAERAQIMPIEKAYPIETVLALLSQYDWSHQRRLSFEYICFGGQNDSPRHAKQLCRLLANLPCRVNLIRYHEGAEAKQGDDLQLASSADDRMEWFRDYLSDHGITTTIRRSRGEDIFAACGMLVNQLIH